MIVFRDFLITFISNTMKNKTLSKVHIQVKSWYRPDLSNPEENQFFYNYRVFIQNNESEAVRLIHRHWSVEHLIFGKQEVNGPGVVGELPIIEPGEQYDYTSGCEFWAPIGRMGGYYTFEYQVSKQLFLVNIPIFTLEFPMMLS